MNNGSDDEDFEFNEENSSQYIEHPTQIKRSFASSDINSLMETDTNIEKSAGGSNEHMELLPQEWINECAKRYASFSSRWSMPPRHNDMLKKMIDHAVEMCFAGRADGTLDAFMADVLLPMFKKYYFSPMECEQWDYELHVEIGETALKVLRMLRGQLKCGAGSRDISAALWEIIFFISQSSAKMNQVLNERVRDIRVDDIDISMEFQLLKDDHPNYTPWTRLAILCFGFDGGFMDYFRFITNNVTESTSTEELTTYVKAFSGSACVMKRELFEEFYSLIYSAADRILSASEEERSVKNLRGAPELHPLFLLYMHTKEFALQIPDHSLLLELLQWRMKFLLRVLHEAPFNGRMMAIENMAQLINDMTAGNHNDVFRGYCMKWLEEGRAVDVLTRDNLHNISYVDRIHKVFERMLIGQVLTTGDLSTIWEAQRGKHDAIQRNFAELIVRLVAYFDNELIDALFHKIQAGWTDGEVSKRAMLIDIVRRIGEMTASYVIQRLPVENRDALIDNCLKTLWFCIRHPNECRDNEQNALDAHQKLLEETRQLGMDYIHAYVQLCAADVAAAEEHAPTSASHLVRILDLVPTPDDDDLNKGSMRQHIICEIESQHLLVQHLVQNVVNCVHSTEVVDMGRRAETLRAFLNCLSFVLEQSRHQLILTEQHASLLWESLVASPQVEMVDRTEGFRFFNNIVEVRVMEKNMQADFFKSYVMKFPPKQLTEDGYACFDVFFKTVNESEAHLRDEDESATNPSKLLGGSYVWDMILEGSAVVSEKAASLWVECLRRFIVDSGRPETTRELTTEVVAKIVEQHEAMKESVTSPIDYSTKKDQLLRCIRVLTGLVAGMDEAAEIPERSRPALGRSAIGRALQLTVRLTKREWETLPYNVRGTYKSDEYTYHVDTHENTTLMEVRKIVKIQLRSTANARKLDTLMELYDQFLLAHVNDGCTTRKFHYGDYKCTMGELGLYVNRELEIRLDRNLSPRGGGELSPCSSTSSCDWMMISVADDGELERENTLPSVALSRDERLIDRLLTVAESPDKDVARHAFSLLADVPANDQMSATLHECLTQPERLRQLLDTSDARFLYNIIMIEAILLPAQGSKLQDYVSSAAIAMLSCLENLPQIASIPSLMRRSTHYRTLAVPHIVNILRLLGMTSMRSMCRQVMDGRAKRYATLISTLIRCDNSNTVEYMSRWIPFRKATNLYVEECNADPLLRDRFHRLLDTHAIMIMSSLSTVTLAAASFSKHSPVADSALLVLQQCVGTDAILDQDFTADRYLAPDLLHASLHAATLVAGACPNVCMGFVGARETLPDPLWIYAIMAVLFHENEDVRILSVDMIANMMSCIRTKISTDQQNNTAATPVSITDVLLGYMPLCKGKDKYGEQYFGLIKDCIQLSRKSWQASLNQVDHHINTSVQFLDEAQRESNALQLPYPDEIYLAARMEVLSHLLDHVSMDRRNELGGYPGGPRLCERLLADFIYTAATPSTSLESDADDGRGGGSTGNGVDHGGRGGVEDSMPRSATHMEMNSSSSLFELNAGGLPRSASAFPLQTRRVAVCPGEQSQKAAFLLLHHLCVNSFYNMQEMHKIFYELFYARTPWTDKRDFDYMPHHVLRGDGELVGLKNGGATCYMNSIFQQLFMIDEVREAVLNVTIPEKHLLDRRSFDSGAGGMNDSMDVGGGVGASARTPDRGEYAIRVLAAVQTLFAHLLGSELESYRPSEFWKVFNFKPNGESVNVREQQDAVEFHNMVSELIDEGLKKCGCEAVCERTFRGVFADEKICYDCPHRYTKEEPFESLSLDVRSHNNLRDSLKEYVKGDVLENDNAYHCEQCNKKVKAVKRMSLSKLPEVLIVQLKRFDFDWEKEQSVKFNDYFEFPYDIDLQPYTLEGLERMERGLQLELNDDYKYILRGVVVHSGQAQGGHYTSFIRNRETGKWYKFDDNDVSDWEPTESNASMKWFGSSEGDSMGRGRKRSRTVYWNAYMLFYEKSETARAYLDTASSSMATCSSSESTSITPSMLMTSSTPVGTCSPSAAAASLSTGASSTATAAAATTSTPSASTTTTTTSMIASSVSPTLREAVLKGESIKQRPVGKSLSPVSHLHRHFSSMSLSSARIRMPRRLEEMLREGNRRVQLERVQYSQHYFHYVFEMSHAALEMMHHTHLDDNSRNLLGFSVMRTFASFVVHNGLFASDDLRRNDDDYDNVKPPLLKWSDMFTFLLSSSDAARIWFVTNILFVPEIVACFLFSSAHQVREFFSDLILRTIHTTEVKGDLTERCYESYVQTDHVLQLHSTMVDFPRLSYLLIHLLGKLPTKYLSLFRSEFIDFYRLIYNITVSHIGLLTAIIRGGLFNSLLMLFSPTASSDNIHSLNRRDNQVYEMVLKLVSCGIRAIRRDEAEEEMPNCYRFAEVTVRRRDVPDLQVLVNFLSKDGGHVRYVHCLVDLIRRTSRALNYAWATDACLFLAYGNPTVSATIIDAICQGTATILTEGGQAACAKLARALFALSDRLEEARFNYLFHDAQLSNPHTASVHGFLEIESIPEHRFEPMVLILLQALEVLPGINEMISQDEKVRRLLTQINARAICRRNSSVPFNQFHNWYLAVTQAEEAARSEHTMESDVMTGDETSGATTSSVALIGAPGAPQPPRPPSSGTPGAVGAATSIEMIGFSPGQLSPSSRMATMSLNAGEKRPLPPPGEGEQEEDGEADGIKDRKRSIGEENAWPRTINKQRTHPSNTVTPMSVPMEDTELLIASSRSSGASAHPSAPPPSYDAAMTAGASAATSARYYASAPPYPPAPTATVHMTETEPLDLSSRFISAGKDDFVVDPKR